MPYDPIKRHERYIRNRDQELEAAKQRYSDNADDINAKKRANYHKNIIEERKKLRERQAKRRARLKKSQNDTTIQ